MTAEDVLDHACARTALHEASHAVVATAFGAPPRFALLCLARGGEICIDDSHLSRREHVAVLAAGDLGEELFATLRPRQQARLARAAKRLAIQPTTPPPATGNRQRDITLGVAAVLCKERDDQVPAGDYDTIIQLCGGDRAGHAAWQAGRKDARRLLTRWRKPLIALAEALLSRQAMAGAEIAAVVGAKLTRSVYER